MAKAQRPMIIVGGGDPASGGFSVKLSSTQAKKVQRVLGSTKRTTTALASFARPS